MGKRFLFLAILLAAVVGTHATDYRKLSGYVRQLVSSSQQAAAQARGTQPKDRQWLTAFMRVDASQADRLLEAYHCRKHAQYGDIAIVSIPTGSIAALTDHPAVRRIEANPSAFLTMDTTAVITGAQKLYQPSSYHIPSSFTGEGVVLGIMDVGFDLTHPNFYDRELRHYRIGAFWDQLSRDTVGSPLPVGRDYLGAEAILAQQHSVDGLIQTHGTHTLGIAAGSGYQSPYRGIAYDADICVVSNAVSSDIELIDSTDYYKYTSATDALGFKYIFDYADGQGKPCVASFSEGYPPYLDSEDSLYAAVLDSLTAIPGHIVVVSAGNENTAYTYMEKPAEAECAGAFIGAAAKAAAYKIKTDGPLQLTLYTYRDNNSQPTDTLTYSSADGRLDSLIIDTLLTGADTCTVYLERYAAVTSDTIYFLQLVANKNLTTVPLALVVSSNDRAIEVFGSSGSSLTNGTRDARWSHAIKGRNILAPGSFPAVICVGSTVHRTGFMNYKGEYKNFANGTESGHRSFYSSTGPTMDGLTKPDVVAPGDNIISSYSSYYIEANPEARDIGSDVEHFQFNDRTYAWNANTGTSMAAPVVAGIIALWLQARPSLTTDDIHEVLRHSCLQPDPTLTYPNNEYGYGAIDAYRGLLYLLGIDTVDAISRPPSAMPRIRLCNGQIVIEDISEGTVNIYDLNGRRLPAATGSTPQ